MANLLDDDKKIAAALKRLEKMSLTDTFDAAHSASRPTPRQLEILKDLGSVQYRWIVAGNQCKPAYSLVKMADGQLKPLGEIRIGDLVMAYDKMLDTQVPSRVINTWRNGIKEVNRYWTGSLFTDSTSNHQMPRLLNNKIVKTKLENADSLLRELEETKAESHQPRRAWENHAITKIEKLGNLEVFDITIEHPDHIYVCDGYYTGNSGKSQLASREIAWVVTDTHPFWKRPANWGHEPLLILMVGQDKRNLETSIWDTKLRPLLDMSEWKITRSGGIIQHAEHKPTQNKIVFLSHADGSDKTRQHLQGYTAHHVWLDEMPSSMEVLEELQRRVDARKGNFIATFTPKFRNDEIRRIVDASKAPVGKKYQMSKLDNPVYAGRLQEELQKLDGYTEAYKRTVLYGDWSTGDSAVYQFNYEKMTVEHMPSTYSPGWRHVASLDPAAKSKFGYSLWAEDAATATWYLVKDEYISGIADPNELFAEVQRRNTGYNLIRQVCDPHEGWYIGLANSKGVTYHVPYDKNNRKTDLIKGLQHALTSGKIKIPRWNATFIDEIQSCQWAENADRIVNASSYHTLDTAQYFVDCMPKSDPTSIILPWHVELRKGNEERKKANNLQQDLKINQTYGRNAQSLSKWSAGRRSINGQ